MLLPFENGEWEVDTASIERNEVQKMKDISNKSQDNNDFDDE